MTCTIYFFAEDQDGNALPFNADFVLMRWSGSQWVVEGTYTIPRGGYYAKTGLLNYPQSYEARPLLDVSYEDEWERPNDETFNCRSSDVTFVYNEIPPVPTEGILRVRARDANTGVYLFNAAVYVDGTYMGLTLGAAYLILTVAPGFHTITLSKDGYDTKTINTYVSAGATVSEDGAMDPVIITGTLEIQSDPSGALAYVDGAYAGMTPLSITKDPGTYNVQVSATGYKDSSIVPAYVESGVTRTVTFVLIPVDGKLTVTAVTPTLTGSIPVTGAAITINGSSIGVTPHTFDLAPGTYTLGVTKPGYITPSVMLANVLSGQTAYLEFILNPEPPKPVICIPSITGFAIPDEIRITFPPPPAAVPMPGAPPLPSLDTLSVPVTFVAAMNCTQDGVSRSDQFPFSADILLMGSTVGPPVTVNAGNNTFDIANAITSLLLAGTITPDLTGIAVALRYPTEIVDGVVTAYTTTELWLHISKIVLEHPIICLPAISDLTSPAEIRLTIVEGGLPTLDPAMDPVTFIASMNCTQGGSPVSVMTSFPAEFYVAGGMIGQIPVIEGGNTIPATQLAAAINAAIASGAITPGMTGFSIAIRYPARIEDGVVTEYASVERTISIVEIRDIFCDLAVSASDPGVIPIDIPAIGLPVPGVSTIPIAATFSAVCDNGAPADLLSYITAEVRVNNILFGPISPDSTGVVDFDLMSNTNWLSSISLGDTTMELKITFPAQLQCTTPTPIGSQDYIKQLIIKVTGPPVPGPVICLPSIPADTVTHPPGIQLSPPVIEGGLPTLDPVSDPVTFRAYMSCSQDGASVTPIFPFYAEFFIEEYKVGDIAVYSGINTISIATLTAAINEAIAAGEITLAMSSFLIKLKYPTRIEDGVPDDYTEIGKTIDITPPVIPGPVICIPSIPSDTVTHPPNIQLSPPVIVDGLPILDPVSDPVTFDASMTCSQDDVSKPTTFPFYAAFYVTSTDEEDKAADIPVYAGINRITIADLTFYINAAITRGDIRLDTTSFGIYLVYPTRIEDGVPGNYTTVGKTIDITPPGVPPEAIVCNITNVTEKEPLIVTISELGIPTVDPCDIDVQLYITPPCGKSMAEILAVTGGFLNLYYADGTYFASIPLDIYGEGVLDIVPYARSWLLTLTEIPTSLDLVLVCPSGVTFSTPVAEYEDVPITVGIEVTGPPLPECVLTDADFYTCPDGTVIQLNECVDDVKVPIVPTPTCPPVVPPTVGRAMVMIIPNTVPEGRTVEIVVQALCAGVESDGEDATLLVDDAAVMTRPTAAGEVTFRWVATGIGTRMVCVSIPASEICPYPGAVCRPINVVTYLPEVKEQVEMELSEYETELAKLRKVREIERERLRGVAVPQGTVRVPSSLAGSTVVIGRISRVVPPEGISITVPAGESIVTIITESVRETVPVLILPGETEKLPWGP